MKLKEWVGEPACLNLESSESPLPTTHDVFKHFSYLKLKADTTNKGNWTNNWIYHLVAVDLITLYKNRKLPTAKEQNMVRRLKDIDTRRRNIQIHSKKARIVSCYLELLQTFPVTPFAFKVRSKKFKKTPDITPATQQPLKTDDTSFQQYHNCDCSALIKVEEGTDSRFCEHLKQHCCLDIKSETNCAGENIKTDNHVASAYNNNCASSKNLLNNVDTVTVGLPEASENCSPAGSSAGPLFMLWNTLIGPYLSKKGNINSDKEQPSTSDRNIDSEEQPFTADSSPCDYNCSQKAVKKQCPHSGTQCELSSCRKRKLNKHLSCELCNSTFTRKCAFTKHMITHSGETTISCEMCSRIFLYKRFLTTHLMNVHGVPHQYNCTVCDFSTSRKSKLDSHLLSHQYNCTVCDFSTNRKPKLDSHLLLHSRQQTFSCEECNLTFPSNYALIKHMKEHRDKSERHYTCTMCDYSCTDETIMKGHLLLHSSNLICSQPGYKHLLKHPAVNCDCSAHIKVEEETDSKEWFHSETKLYDTVTDTAVKVENVTTVEAFVCGICNEHESALCEDGFCEHLKPQCCLDIKSETNCAGENIKTDNITNIGDFIYKSSTEVTSTELNSNVASAYNNNCASSQNLLSNVDTVTVGLPEASAGSSAGPLFMLRNTLIGPYLTEKRNIISDEEQPCTSDRNNDSEEQPFTCTMCDYICTDETIMKGHLLLHSSNLICSQPGYKHLLKKKPLSCVVYSSFIQKSSPIADMMNDYGVEYCYRCPMCHYSCSDETILKGHLLLHSGSGY